MTALVSNQKEKNARELHANGVAPKGIQGAADDEHPVEVKEFKQEEANVEGDEEQKHGNLLAAPGGKDFFCEGPQEVALPDFSVPDTVPLGDSMITDNDESVENGENMADSQAVASLSQTTTEVQSDRPATTLSLEGSSDVPTIITVSTATTTNNDASIHAGVNGNKAGTVDYSKGVHFNKLKSSWDARIFFNGSFPRDVVERYLRDRLFLGTFPTQKQAAHIRDQAMHILFRGRLHVMPESFHLPELLTPEVLAGLDGATVEQKMEEWRVIKPGLPRTGASAAFQSRTTSNDNISNSTRVVGPKRKADEAFSSLLPPPKATGPANKAAFLKKIRRRQGLVCEDITEGQEAWPIPVFNETDDGIVSVPNFEYVVESAPATKAADELCEAALKAMPDGGQWCGIAIARRGSDSSMSRARKIVGKEEKNTNYHMSRERKKENNSGGYYEDGRLCETVASGVWECCSRFCSGKACAANRVVSAGLDLPLEVFRTVGRGWGVRCSVDVLPGTIVATYEGELISNQEAEDRLSDQYLFDMDHFQLYYR